MPWEVKPNLSMTNSLAYVLGVLKGDGYVYSYRKGRIGNYRIALSVTNVDFAREFEKALKAVGLNPQSIRKIEKPPGYAKKPQFQVEACSKRFVEWYTKLSLDSLEKLLSTSQLAFSFLKGFYQSEGYVYKHRRSWYVAIYNKNLALCDLILRILRREGFNPIFFVDGKQCGTMKLTRKREAERFLEAIS
jgi:intein-encoded DNA endonuclease-like protein